MHLKMKFSLVSIFGPLPHIGLLVNAVPALSSLYSSTALPLAFIRHPRRSITLYVCWVYINNPKISPLQCSYVFRTIVRKISRSFSPYGFYSFSFPIQKTSVLCLLPSVSLSVMNTVSLQRVGYIWETVK